jgi:hypothetical protein
MPISASPRWTTSPTRGELWPAAGETRRIFDFSSAAMPNFSMACARKMPLVPPLAAEHRCDASAMD